MTFQLPPLPYSEDALEPAYSARTIGFHYGKHHKTYVDTLNKLVAGTDLEGKTLEQVIMSVAGDPTKQAVFNNAAQVWNHTFFWNSMKPGGGGLPDGELATLIADTFGGWDKEEADFSSHKLVESFKTAAAARFGSGWVWLVVDNGDLKIVSTANADMPAASGVHPLLVVDVWEHAYYLDFRNVRPNYLANFLDKLVNWEVVADLMAKGSFTTGQSA